MISIVDYGSGNIRAIGNIYDRLKIDYTVINTPDQLNNASKIILPGVGAFDETMGMLNNSGLREALDDCVLTRKIPILGICVGMQILAKSSEEGELGGLGWIDASVKKIDKTLLDTVPKLPHLGWNSVTLRKETELFRDIDEETGFYFIHTYYFSCNREEDILSETFYGKQFTSSVNVNNIYGVQFHPEKSHQNGINVLKNFATRIC